MLEIAGPAEGEASWAVRKAVFLKEKGAQKKIFPLARSPIAGDV